MNGLILESSLRFKINLSISLEGGIPQGAYILGQLLGIFLVNLRLTNDGESIEDNGEELDDFDGWEFKVAESVTPTGDD
ncbi:uncharacterized protein E6C27_scaffold239G001510 [Cucumis melo var. makuwa]|uniref:Uncharacterized protein n=1 Tax=Cucumis melo var. makuwa TaxID=1194695 RepID=A0A5A7ST77_CUCMM|nr:uncharacterized protein E6C27_scaffold239G001510 [Cucumis melo var. makuwa]